MSFRKYLSILFIVSISVFANAQDVSKDIKLGAQGLEQVKEQIGIYHFDPLDSFIQKLGKRLAQQLDAPLFKYEFYLLDSPEPNAFALPGGKVFVTRGLLALPLTEDELAGVIGHEIIHSNNRHGIKQQHGSIVGTILSIPGLIIGGIFQGPVGQAVASPFLVGNELLQADYSRGHEKEADEQGVRIAAKAGYRPHELANILARLQAEAELLTGEKETESYFASHPYTPKRVKLIDKESAKLVPSNLPHIAPADSFQLLFNGLMLSDNPDNGYVENEAFYHPKYLLKFKLNKGWKTAATPTTFSFGSEAGDAVISFKIAEDSLDYGEFLDQFEKDMYDYARVKPDNKEKIEWFGHRGGLMEYETESKGEKIKFQIYAIDYGKQGLMKAVNFYKAKSEGSIESFLKDVKVINKSELAPTKVTKLLVVQANEGESLAEIIKRKGSAELEDFTKVINEKSLEHKFNNGDYVKILKKVPYKFH